MEQQEYTCQFKSMYTSLPFSEADTAKIAEGQFPLILAKDGSFTKLYVSESELDNYGIFDALDSDVEAQRELHGENLPIVWVRAEGGGMAETGFEHQVRVQVGE
jgi:muconolactone delta-isomerase